MFSLFTSVAALGLLQLGIRLLGAADAAILCMFEPLTSFIAGVLLLNEELSLLKAAAVSDPGSRAFYDPDVSH